MDMQLTTQEALFVSTNSSVISLRFIFYRFKIEYLNRGSKKINGYEKTCKIINKYVYK